MQLQDHPHRLTTKKAHAALFALVCLSVAAGSTAAFAQTVSVGIKEGTARYMKAYPDLIVGEKNGNIVWRDGTTMPYSDGKTPATYLELLDNCDLADQLAEVYPRATPSPAPAHNHDPGRVRNDPFFRKMYGATEAEVKRHLVPVDWFGTSVLVTTVNNVNTRLEAVRDELATKPELRKYLVKPGGTFEFRVIKLTHRLSMHSYGIAIDINTARTDYWQWTGKKEGSANITYKNRIPIAIVEVFEKHGFIWGGKWYHYDTMHFEYRPEVMQ